MAIFNAGETVICACEVKDDTGTYKDPATSMAVTIIGPGGPTVVSAATMTKDSTGHYHYDWLSSASSGGGIYTVKYIATDGTRITIETETFELKG